MTARYSYFQFKKLWVDYNYSKKLKKKKEEEEEEQKEKEKTAYHVLFMPKRSLEHRQPCFEFQPKFISSILSGDEKNL